MINSENENKETDGRNGAVYTCPYRNLVRAIFERLQNDLTAEVITDIFPHKKSKGADYIRLERGKAYPMLPLDLLRIPIFTTSVATSIVSFTAQMLVMVGMPFMLVNTFGYDAVGIGLLMTSWPLAIVFVAPLAGMLINHVHPGILGGVGLAMLSAGCFLLSFIPADAGHSGLVLRLLLCGAGFGVFQSPNNHILLTSAPTQRSGSASGMLATARLTGQTLGAALVAMLFHLYGPMAPHDAMLLGGILAACGAVCSCLRLRERMVGR